MAMADRLDADHSGKISTACDECKRRKIKCNGYQPCRRCRNLHLNCVYARPGIIASIFKSDEFQSIAADVATLQKDVSDLKTWTVTQQCQWRQLSRESSGLDVYQTANTSPVQTMTSTQPHLSNDISLVSPALTSRAAAIPGGAQFFWPTNSEHDLTVARASLQHMGIIHSDSDQTIQTPEVTWSIVTPVSMNMGYVDMMSLEDAQHYSSIYEEGCDWLYPVVDMSRLRQMLELRAYVGDLSAASDSNCVVTSLDRASCKMVIVIGLALEGQIGIAAEVCSTVLPFLESQVLRQPTLETLPLMVLMATYQFIADDEHSAWRTIGSAARTCLELGLHQRETLYAAFKSPESLSNAVRLFWTVYSLDRRWSLGTGLPWTINDANVDPFLPEPESGDVYLKHIVKCNKIMARICSVDWDYRTSNTLSIVNDLESQVQCWYEELPSFLKLDFLDSEETNDRKAYKRKVLLDLRSKLAKLHILRPVLHSASTIQAHTSIARRAVSVAKSIISQLRIVNQVANVYQDHQALYNYFLKHSLAVILLAIAHAPADFLADTRDEFFDALELLRHLRLNSPSSSRLWNIIQEFKIFRTKIKAMGRDTLISLPVPSMSCTTSSSDSSGWVNASINQSGSANETPDSLSTIVYPVLMENPQNNFFMTAATANNSFHADFNDFLDMI